MASLLSPPPSPGAISCSASPLSPGPSASSAFGADASRPTFQFPVPSSTPLLFAPGLRSRQHKQERVSPANAVTGSCATAETCERQTSEAPPLYAVLGIGQNASASEIKSAYRQMARRYHPDVCPGSHKGNGSQMFLQVREAYDILSDPDLRADYDFSFLHPFSAHALGRGFAQSSMERRRRARSDESGAWRRQWEAQLNRLHQKQDRGSSSETWGARIRRRNEESN